MAFSLVVNYWVSGSQSLTNGIPFKLDSIDDFAETAVVRYEQGGPLQEAAVDLGYRLEASEFALNILFYAATDALLDSYRDLLFDIFRPTWTVTLVATRDDAAVRYLSCVVMDAITIDLVPEQAASRLHRATVKLRAANPLWRSSLNQPSYTGGSAQTWWTAGGVIGTANVMEHVEFPTNGQAWTYAGTITGDWSVAFRSAQEPESGTPTAFHAGTGALQTNLTKDARVFYKASFTTWQYGGASSELFATDLAVSTQNYITTQELIAGPFPTRSAYVGGTSLLATPTVTDDYDISGTARRWRSDSAGSASTYWTNEFPKAAVYNKSLSQAERIALDAWMSGTGIAGTISAVNAGDVPEYPLITIRGPLVSPILTNVTTGDNIDLTGITLGSAEQITIDLRTGDKLIYNLGGSSLISSMASPLDLVDFYLAPAPIATGGTNSIRVQGGSVSTSTYVEIAHYSRYTST